MPIFILRLLKLIIRFSNISLTVKIVWAKCKHFKIKLDLKTGFLDLIYRCYKILIQRSACYLYILSKYVYYTVYVVRKSIWNSQHGTEVETQRNVKIPTLKHTMKCP